MQISKKQIGINSRPYTNGDPYSDMGALVPFLSRFSDLRNPFVLYGKYIVFTARGIYLNPNTYICARGALTNGRDE